MSRYGLYVVFRLIRKPGQKAIGFVIKPASARFFSERKGLWRGAKIGPVYVRTFHRHEEQS